MRTNGLHQMRLPFAFSPHPKKMGYRVLTLFLIFICCFSLFSCQENPQNKGHGKAQSMAAAYLISSSLSDASIEADMQAFHRSPQVFMRQIPAKYDKAGMIVNRSRFSMEDIQTGNFMQKKQQFIQRLVTAATPADSQFHNKAEIRDNDRPEKLTDNGSTLLMTLNELDEKNLQKAKISQQPWSDDYWPTKKGLLAHRYHGSRPPHGGGWRNFYDFFIANPPDKLLAEGKSNTLSPAEKYDYLVGASDWSLTNLSWKEGEGIANLHGDVEDWMGICHGWAPASFMLPRPKSIIEVQSMNGQWITFYPSDIKALGSLLWAKANFPSRFIGGRCNTKKPEREDNGHIADQDCFDNNPGTWHLSVVNQVGVAQRSFILDVTYDYEVWNQPILGYSYVYFNPVTNKTSSQYTDVAIDLASYEQDPFKKYRSPHATRLVGVKMKIEYMAETEPVPRRTDIPQYDAVDSTSYIYDLELDEKGTVIGGEWYTLAHPDFLWTPTPDSRVSTIGERIAQGDWDMESNPLPESWSIGAVKSLTYGQPLAKIVNALFTLSSGTAGGGVGPVDPGDGHHEDPNPDVPNNPEDPNNHDDGSTNVNDGTNDPARTLAHALSLAQILAQKSTIFYDEMEFALNDSYTETETNALISVNNLRIASQKFWHRLKDQGLTASSTQLAWQNVLKRFERARMRVEESDLPERLNQQFIVISQSIQDLTKLLTP